jgi:hypothetical protein
MEHSEYNCNVVFHRNQIIKLELVTGARVNLEA